MNTENKRRWRKKTFVALLVVTLIFAAGLTLAHWNAAALSDTVFQFDLALLTIATGASMFIFSLLWLFWLLISGLPRFFSRWIPVLGVLAAACFFVLFQPRIGGGLSVARWEPRFWRTRYLAIDRGVKVTDLTTTTAADSPGFLGIHRDGVFNDLPFPLERLGTQCRLRWTVPVGEGWSGFAVVNGFAVTMMQDGADELVVCYDIASGDSQWTYRNPRRHEDPLGGIGPRSTPTIDRGRVYAVGAVGDLLCLDGSTGELIWSVAVPEVLGIPMSDSSTGSGIPIQTEETSATWGRSGSPLIYQDLVVVPGGGARDGDQVSLIAFDRRTGEERWRGGDRGISYASPSLISMAGAQQILIVTEDTVAGHDPTTGDELWSHPWPGHSDSDASTSQAVWLRGDADEPTDAAMSARILLSKGYGVGVELIEVQAGDEFRTSTVWKNPSALKTKMTNAVVYGDYAFGLSDGILECVDLKSGQRMWKNGRYRHGQLLLTGDKLLVHAERGFLSLVDASPEGYRELGRVSTIRGICWNTFCLYDRYVLVRSDLEAACLELSEPYSED